jgi:uncharacterized iron-regulated membrane protein
VTTLETLSDDPKDSRPLSADDAVSLASHLLSGAIPIWVNFPQKDKSTYMVKMRFPEDRSFNGSSTVWLDQFSGRSTSIWNSRTDSLGGRLDRFSREGHTGDSLGYSGRLEACLMSLTLVVQTMTGIGMWWKTRAKICESDLHSARSQVLSKFNPEFPKTPFYLHCKDDHFRIADEPGANYEKLCLSGLICFQEEFSKLTHGC